MRSSEPPRREEGAAELDAWAEELAVDRAAAERSRIRSLRLQASQTSQFAGILVELAERGGRVVIRAAGRSLAGTLRGVGVDFVALGTERGSVLVRTASITALEPSAGDSSGPSGPRDVAPATDLATMLATLADVEAAVTVVGTDGTSTFSGDLVLVGDDFLALRPADRRAPVYLPLPAVGLVESPALG